MDTQDTFVVFFRVFADQSLCLSASFPGTPLCALHFCHHKLRTEPSGSPHIFSPACPEPLGGTNRCIIPPREHPPERNRMPRPGLPRRKRNHHSRILPALLERSRQCLQPEIEPGTRHESGRVRRPPGAPFFERTIPRPLRQRRGQPRHQVRAPPAGSLQTSIATKSPFSVSCSCAAPRRPANSARAPSACTPSTIS